MGLRPELLASSMLVASCTCGEPTTEAPPPNDPGPRLAPWSGPVVVLDGEGPIRARGWSVPLPDLPASGPPLVVELQGDAVAQTDNLHRALGHPGKAAITAATAERTSRGEFTHVRLRWHLFDAPEEPPSLEPAPSWEALCADAIACFRTGPWPDAARWLASVPPTSVEDASSAVVLWGGEWPHVAADLLQRARSRVPEAARGFFDTALAGLGDVVFAGGRLDRQGIGLAFARVPATWVNFTSGVLAWAGLPPGPMTLSDGVIVSWSALAHGGVVMALDDGDTPTMGWIAYATEPDAFAWLRTAPRTAAGAPSLWMHVERVSELPLPSIPGWLSTDDAMTLRLEVEDDWLTARADVRKIR